MSMIERVARAMFADDEAHSDQWGWDQHPPRDWGSIEECERDAYRRSASAAIRAMREPTEKIVDNGSWVDVVWTAPKKMWRKRNDR